MVAIAGSGLHVFAPHGLRVAAGVTDHVVETLAPQDMSEDMLVACVTLPMWFPPVRVDDKVFIDSVFVTDANLMEAVRRGADELCLYTD